MKKIKENLYRVKFLQAKGASWSEMQVNYKPHDKFSTVISKITKPNYDGLSTITKKKTTVMKSC